MDFLITDGGDGGDDHVEAVEPGPALDVVKARDPDGHENQQGEKNEFEIAKSLQTSCRFCTNYKTERPSAYVRKARFYSRSMLLLISSCNRRFNPPSLWVAFSGARPKPVARGYGSDHRRSTGTF